MRILHMLWLPFAYWFFPNKLANHALRGTLKRYGCNLSQLPIELTQIISKRTIDRQKLTFSRRSVFKKLYELQLLIDHNACVIVNLLQGKYKFEWEFSLEVVELQNDLKAYQILK